MFFSLSIQCLMRGTHTEETLFQCFNCKKTFSEARNLKKHERTYTGEKLFKCPKCAMRFSIAGYLKEHEGTHKGEKPFKCTNVTMASQHQVTWKPMRGSTQEYSTIPFKCTMSDKSFSSSSNFETHKTTQEWSHLSAQSVTSVFPRQSSLKEHERTHTG